jgi:DNA-binding MarR family transcriptional regulator
MLTIKKNSVFTEVIIWNKKDNTQSFIPLKEKEKMSKALINNLNSRMRSKKRSKKMTNNYLIIPLDLFPELSLTDKIILSQLAYMKKAFETLTVSNTYLKKQLNLSISTIKRSIYTLSKYNYIKTDLKNNYKRTIFLSQEVLMAYGIKYPMINKNFVKTEITPVLKEFLTSFKRI